MHPCRYSLPKFVISEPSNLARDGSKPSSSARRMSSGGAQVELPAVAAGAGSQGSPGGGARADAVPPSQVAVR